jgi:hypothetical protein
MGLKHGPNRQQEPTNNGAHRAGRISVLFLPEVTRGVACPASVIALSLTVCMSLGKPVPSLGLSLYMDKMG